MFRKFKQNLIFMYTLTTGMILTLIVLLAFLYFFVSQENRRETTFQNLLLTFTSKLQTESHFTDSYLAQMELQNGLIIHVEENGQPLFFPGAYKTGDNRLSLLNQAMKEAESEGIYEESHPISSSILRSSVFTIKGEEKDDWRGNVLIVRTENGYKKLILLLDETSDRVRMLNTGLLYLLMDVAGVFLLYLTSRRFVMRSTKPLEDTYRKQQEFVAAASHELRSPLAVIEANAAAIADVPAETPRLLSVIHRECARGSGLIKNLLLLTALDCKHMISQSQLLEIDELLLNLLEMYEPVFHAKNSGLLLELPESPLPTVKADKGLCCQILSILLDNAAAYGLENNVSRKVILRAESSRHEVTVFIIDFGSGICEKEKERIFERFYRSDSSRSQKEHYGLGLSIAAEMAQLQGLKLDVGDTKDGGATFTLKFRL